MSLLHTLKRRRSRARVARNAEFAARLRQRPLDVYQAARVTGGIPTEVAVWLLMERGYVHVARDGRVRAVTARFDVIDDDPAQEAIYGRLRSAPTGRRLHELIADPECAAKCENVVVPGVRELFPGARRGPAAAYLRAHCQRLLDERFAELGRPEEREALHLYREALPAPRVPSPVPRRRSRGGRGGSGTTSSGGSHSVTNYSSCAMGSGGGGGGGD
ncbi:hypothetical protein OG216_23070 [Streptomycetaceae bacterium NBC_01309]